MLGVISPLVMLSCSTTGRENTAQPNRMETNEKNVGSLQSLYPKPMTVAGAEGEGKVDWLVERHPGMSDQTPLNPANKIHNFIQ